MRGDDPLSELKSQKDIHAIVEAFLDSLLSEQGNRLVVFIDELDRCKPSYAVHLLERIKHYFSNDRITFVFSVNVEELQHTVRRYYGEGFDASRYLDRFFDYRMAGAKKQERTTNNHYLEVSAWQTMPILWTSRWTPGSCSSRPKTLPRP
jgi:predicted KAP-like P-loop ATPase